MHSPSELTRLPITINAFTEIFDSYHVNCQKLKGAHYIAAVPRQVETIFDTFRGRIHLD